MRISYALALVINLLMLLGFSSRDASTRGHYPPAGPLSVTEVHHAVYVLGYLQTALSPTGPCAACGSHRQHCAAGGSHRQHCVVLAFTSAWHNCRQHAAQRVCFRASASCRVTLGRAWCF